MPAPYHYLLVDDDPTDRLLAEEAFSHLSSSCTLSCAASGEDALQKLRSGEVRPDVILLDINMPGLTGFQVLEQLKQEPSLRTIPVVMLSTSKANADITQAYKLNASSYLVKSSGFDAFVQQAEAFLSYWQANRVPMP